MRDPIKVGDWCTIKHGVDTLPGTLKYLQGQQVKVMEVDFENETEMHIWVQTLNEKRLTDYLLLTEITIEELTARGTVAI